MVRLAASVLLLAIALPLSAAADDDDWGVTRSAFDPRLVGRYKAMLQRNPGDSYAMGHLIKLYSKHRSVGQLVGEYEKAALAKPDSYANWLILGNLYRRSGKSALAIGRYLKAAALKPRSSDPVAALADLYRKTGKLPEAAETYQKALVLTSSKRAQKRILKALAEMALSNQDLGGAKRHFSALVSLDPNNKLLRIELARILARSGNEDEAIKEYQALLTRSRDSSYRANLNKEIAMLQQKKGNYEQALASYRKAMAMTARGHWLRKDLTERIIAIYRKREQLPQLITYYEKRWKRRGFFEESVLAKLYDETGNEAAALKAYRAALARSPNAIDVRLRLIALFDRAGQETEVTDQYRKLAILAPGEPRYRLELAKRLYARGQKKQAIAVLDKCGRRFSRDASVHSALADLFSRWGERNRAMREARLLVRIEPQDVSHVVNLGEQHYVAGRRKKALEIWKRLLSAIPIRHKALARLAEVYSQHELVADAVKLYRKAIKLSPTTLAYRRNLAMLLETSRRSNEAIAAWQELLDAAIVQKARRQLIAESRSRIIGLLHRSYRLRYYARSYARRFAGPPPDIEAGRFLAESWIKRRRYPEAEKVYLQILRLVPQDIETLTALESVYRRQRKLAKAVELLERLAKLNTGETRHYYQRIADLQLQLFNDREALKYAHKAIELGTPDPKAYKRLAELYEKKGDFTGAMKAYDQALQLNPNLYPVHLARARLQTRLAKYEAAAQSYRRLMEIARTPEMIRKAFHRTLSLSDFLGTLEDLERSLVERAVSTNPNSDTYKGLLVQVYLRKAPALIEQLRHGEAGAQAVAREQLNRMGRMGISALLDRLAQLKRDRSALIRTLGYLGNSHAVVALHRTLDEKEAPSEVVIYANHAIRSIGANGMNNRTRRVNERVLTALALGRLADRRSIPHLLRLQSDVEGAIREAATWALAQIPDPRASRALFSALADRRANVQMLACLGLGLRGNKGLQPVLEEVMLDPKRAEKVRAACAWAQGVLQNPNAIVALEKALRSGSDLVQKSAAVSLGLFNTSRSRQVLLMSLWTRWPKVQDAIRWALGNIEAAPKPARLQKLPDLWAIDGNLELGGFTERLFNTTRRALPAHVEAGLASLVWKHPHLVAQGITDGLARHRDVLVRLLKELDRHPKRLALGLLVSERQQPIGAPPPGTNADPRLDGAIVTIAKQVEPALRELLNHPDAEVRRLATRVWIKCRPKTLSRDIRPLLNDEAPSVRIALFETLGATQQIKALSRSQWPLKSRSWMEREAALRAFAEGDSDADTVSQIARALTTDDNGFVREQAAKALGKLGAIAARPALKRALEDSVWQVRVAACKALEKLGSEKSPQSSGSCLNYR